MIPRFALVRARSLDEAFRAIAAGGGDAAFLAGGTELLQVMKMGLAAFGTLVDIKGIADLHGIGIDVDGTLRIGAATTHREIERSAVVQQAVPALATLERGVANVRVRNQGTLGGNLSFAEPHSDPATFLLATDARVVLAGPNGRRVLGIADFVLGPLFTARDVDEVVTAVEIPARAPDEGRGYAKLAFFERPAVSVAVRLRVAGGSVADATVAVGSMVDSPTVVGDAGAALVGAPVEGDAGAFDAAIDRCRQAFAGVDAVADLNGSADYKRHLAGVLVASAARDAIREATTSA
jgi:aerobic carbon-monoxide dehydrogenase medium subunit